MANIILGTWSWGAGMFGGDSVFGSHTDEHILQPVFDAATEAGLRTWDTATAYANTTLFCRNSRHSRTN